MQRHSGWWFTLFIFILVSVMIAVLPSSEDQRRKATAQRYTKDLTLAVPNTTKHLFTDLPSVKPTVDRKSLNSTTISPTVTPMPTAHIGDRGDTVRLLQTQLSELGYLNGEIDGIFGRITEEAVRSFQQHERLEKTGVIDSKTSAILYVCLNNQRETEQTVVKESNKQTKVEYADYRDSASKNAKYVLNTSSRKFHKPSCKYVKKIKPKNYREYTGTRDEVTKQGYVACKVCCP